MQYIASVHTHSNDVTIHLHVCSIIQPLSLCLIRKTTSHTVEHNVPADEGYEEGKMDDNRKFSTPVTHLNFINFANARQRKQGKKVGYRVPFCLLCYNPLFKIISVLLFSFIKNLTFHEQATATAKKRGEELLDMIRLDTVNFTLFELAPVPYEVYMKIYGCSNTLQVIMRLYVTHVHYFQEPSFEFHISGLSNQRNMMVIQEKPGLCFFYKKTLCAGIKVIHFPYPLN